MSSAVRWVWGAMAFAVIGAVSAHAEACPDSHSPAEMSAWASEVDELVRGPVDVAHPEFGPVTNGQAEWALGPSQDQFDVVSLGDGGSLTLWFETGIRNGLCDDFAVFENGFLAAGGGFFGEFAFVEVSSDGVLFARFDATSLREDPVAGGETVDPDQYANLGGKHLSGIGTGFDLEELVGHPLVVGGQLDLADVRYVRLVDVVGDGSTFDQFGEPLYDPYPTPFATGGFDAEAIGVLHLPEPGVAALLAGAVLVLAASRRRHAARPQCSAKS